MTNRNEYTHLGTVTEFRYSAEIGQAFSGLNELKWLVDWGTAWNFVASELALVFVDNHDNQRGHGGGGDTILNYKLLKEYKMATAFALAHTFGIVRLMSSFNFNTTDMGPPADVNGNIISPVFTVNGECEYGWVCEHRWADIYQMVDFRNVVKGTKITNWWDNGRNQIAFCRGDAGFIAFNGETSQFSGSFQTDLPPGKYCDIISGTNVNGICSGLTLVVDASKVVQIYNWESTEEGVLAIHIGARVRENNQFKYLY